MKQKLVSFALLWLAAFALCGVAAGQAVTASGSLQGTVVDSQGAVVPNAAITLTENATGAVRSTTTNDSGNYRFDVLTPGMYTIKVAKQGFGTQTASNSEMFVQRTTTQNFALKPGAVSETVEVQAEAPVLDQQKTSVGMEITPNQVEDLPLNGRDFANLAVLAPGAKPVNSYDPTKNRIAVFAVNGSNGRNVNVTVNGIDDKDNTVGGPVMQLPLEAVEEFNISTERFSAVNGRSEGAAVNVITKAGTNDYHGSAYVWDTETALNAMDYFSSHTNTGAPVANPNKPDFSRQQFGGSIGGPVRKDKDFLFFAIERLREHTAIPITPTAFNELTIAKPLGAQPVSTVPTPYFDWRYTGRFDHHFTPNESFFFTYNHQGNNSLNDQDGNTVDGTQTNTTTNQLQLINATLNSVLRPTVVNALTAGFQYWNNKITTGQFLPLFSFPDASFGTNGNVPQGSIQRKWQFKDDISIVHGNHSFKTGVDYVWEPTLGGYFEFNPTLTLGWFDDPSVITTNTAKYPQGFATPGALQSMALAGGNPAFQFSAKMFGTYVQDDWKVRHNLTLNLGLRWDKDWGLYGENVIPQARTYLALKAINSPFASSIPDPDSKDFSPRIGFAYSLGSSGRQVIRGGYGIYYGQTFINIPLFMVQQANPVLFTTLFSISHGGVGAACAPQCLVPGTGVQLDSYRWGIDPVPVPPPPPTVLPNGSTGRLVDPNFRNPMSQQINLGYSYQVTNSSVIELDLVHELAVHEPKTVNINPQTCPTCPRILNGALATAGQPTLGTISNNEAISNSDYNGGTVSYRRRMSHNIAFTSTYTLSWARSYRGSAASFGNTASDPFAPLRAVDYGYVPNDERHRWVNSAVVNLPWGFQISPIMQLASARPYNLTEGITDVLGFGSGNGGSDAIVLNSAPNNFTGTSGFTSAQLRTCLAAATCHELPFDFARGQGFFQLDSRVSKAFKFGERKELSLMFQGFDLTNRANFGSTYQGNIRSSIFGLPTGYITPAGTIIPKSFRAEFGARFTF